MFSPASLSISYIVGRAVFMHGPKGPGPRAAYLKKLRLKYGMQEKKAVHKREI
jgi:hypothetical protein